MAIQYINYGALGDNNPPKIPVKQSTTQVYKLTHDESGNSLSYLNKAFISFTYGDKKIEDFGLIAVTVNDRLDRQTGPESEDYTTDYKMLHGQYYWGSHYLAREMNITLVTDGVTQQQLDNFKYWFAPGEIRELIMAQHPNRAIMARVQGTPQIFMLPFHKKVKKTIPGLDEKGDINFIEEQFIVIEYKGNIELTFVMDQPFWYAKNSVLGKKEIVNDKVVLADSWINVNGEIENILDKEAYKIMLQDKIPTGSMATATSGIIFAGFPDLHQYDIEKMEYMKERWVIDENDPNKENDDTPIVYAQGSVDSILTGAIVGEVVINKFTDNQEIIEIPESFIIDNYYFNNSGEIIIPDENFIEKNFCKIIITSLHIKKNSKINFIGNKGYCDIIVYSDEKNTFDYKQIISPQIKSYIFQEDCYIKLDLIVPRTEEQNNVSINLNQYLSMSLIMHTPQSQEENLGLILNNENLLNYFYSGNAPSYPIISFSVPIVFDDKTGHIILFNNNGNILNLQSEFSHQLKLINPNIFNAYNKTIDILNNSIGKDITTLIQQLRQAITHPIVRNWIINCINIYFNNMNNSYNQSYSSEFILNTQAKNQLLKYMPYLFASNEEAGININNQSPETFETFNTSKIDVQVKKNTRERIPIVSDQIYQDIFNIRVDPILTEQYIYLQLQIENKNQLATSEKRWYRWQFTTDASFKKWYPLEGLNTIEEISENNVNNFRWAGVTDSILRLYNITENDTYLNGTVFIRCLVSNNAEYNYTPIYRLTSYDSSLAVFCDQSNMNNITTQNVQQITENDDIYYEITVNQNNQVKLIWYIEGNWIDFSNNNLSNYFPEIYYCLSGSNTWLSLSNSLINDSDNKQQLIINSQNYLYDVKLKAQNNTFTLSFIPRQSDINGALTDMKFKLKVYKEIAQTNSDYEESTYIKIDQIKKIDISNVVYTSTYSKQKLSVNVQGYDNCEVYQQGTVLTIQVSHIKNFQTYTNDNYKSYFIINQPTAINKISYVYIKNNMITTSNNETTITYQYTLNLNDTRIKQISLHLIGNGGNEFDSVDVPGSNNYICQFKCATNTEENSSIENFYNWLNENKKEVFSYYGIIDNDNSNQIQNEINMYYYSEQSNSSLTLKLLSSEMTLPSILQSSDYLFSYQWYKRNSSTSAWAAINGATENYYNIPAITLNDKGYYKCQINFTLGSWDANNNGYNYNNFISQLINLTPMNNNNQQYFITVDVIQYPILQDIQIRLQLKPDEDSNIIVDKIISGEWKYYSKETNNQFDDENDKKINITEDTLSNIIIECPYTGEIIDNVILQIINNSSAQKIEYNMNIDNSILKYSYGFSKRNAAIIKQLIDAFTYKVIAQDKWENKYKSNSFSYTFNTSHSERFVNLTYNCNSVEKEWQWPTVDVGKTGDSLYIINTIIAKEQKYYFDYKNNKWEIYGVIPTKEFNSTIDMNALIQNSKSKFTIGNTTYTGNLTVLRNNYDYSQYISSTSTSNIRQTNDFNTIIQISSNEIQKYQTIVIELQNNNSQWENSPINYTLCWGWGNSSEEISFEQNCWKLTLLKEDIEDHPDKDLFIQLKVYQKEKFLENDTSRPYWSTIGSFNNPNENDIKELSDYLYNSDQFTDYAISKDNPIIISLVTLQGIKKEEEEEEEEEEQAISPTIQSTPKRGLRFLAKGAPTLTLQTSDNMENSENIQQLNNASQNNKLVIKQTCPIEINCATGQYTMQFKYNKILWPDGKIEASDLNNFIANPNLICNLSSLRNGQSYTSIDSIGDMILENNFIFQQQNHFDIETNTIKPWTNQDKTLCHKLTYDGQVPLQHFSLDYKNYYL